MSTNCRMFPPNMPKRPSRIDGRRVDRQDSGLRQRLIGAVLILAAMTPGAVRPVHAADAAFTQFIASLWPEAQAAGVSRATFDAETKGLEPDYKLPDLILPGRPATGAPSQAEFVQVPADYIKEAAIARLAAEGQRLMQKYRDALNAIEARFGVPATVVLAIWAYEVEAPANVDCTLGVPEVTKPIGEWLREGFVPVRGQKLSAAELAQPASLLQPEGIYGPSFLTTKNYFVIKEYNFSDLYVLFVGHLGDRMASPQPFATPWSASKQLRTKDVEAMQRGLTRGGLYKEKIDGKAGMQTRAALGAYQKSAGLKVDCWPSEEVLRSIQAAR